MTEEPFSTASVAAIGSRLRDLQQAARELEQIVTDLGIAEEDPQRAQDAMTALRIEWENKALEQAAALCDRRLWFWEMSDEDHSRGLEAKYLADLIRKLKRTP